MSLDELELELRRLRGVLAVGFVETSGVLIVEVQAGADAYEGLPRDATALAVEHAGGPVAVEVVRWGDGGGREPRLRFVELGGGPAEGRLTVRLERDGEEAVGRAPADRGLLAAVEATVYAARVFVPELPYLPGWARVLETTPDRRFVVVASVTDPHAQQHRRGAADGSTPVEAAARATLAALNRTLAPLL